MAGKNTSGKTSGKKNNVTLALQGGGTHGAFTWGALDELLTMEELTIDTITATSGGAMNAVILADALLRDGKLGASKHLKTFWRRVSLAVSMLPLNPLGMNKLLGNIGIDMTPSSIALDYLTRMFSPYQFNLFDLNPLREIIDEMVDFDALRNQRDIEIYIGTTSVTSGKNRVFSTRDLSLEVIMASSCLPFLFKTVMIDDEPYWDGGYTGNPPLYPLMKRPQERDVILIHSAPLQDENVPTTAADILDRATEISFNNALIQEIRALDNYNKTQKTNPVRMHVIESNELLSGLGRASKLNAEWDFLTHLHDIGAQAARDWAEAHMEDVGATSSADIHSIYLADD